MSRRRPSPALVVACIALVAALTGGALARVPASDGDVHLCYSKQTGDVKVVDIQSDHFGCERNWRGFILDSKPTSLTSPNGDFSVQVTDAGITMGGNGQTVKLTNGAISINSDTQINVQSSGSAAIRAPVVTIDCGNRCTGN